MTANQTDNNKAELRQFTDLKTVLSKYLYHWPLFLTGLLMAFAGSYIYLKTVNSVYEVSATILVKDEKKSPREKSALQELDQTSSPKIAEAEIEILRSKKLMNRVVRDLNLATNYSVKRDFKTIDLYKDSPLSFILIKANKAPFDTRINVLIKDKETFEIQNFGKSPEIFKFNAPIKSSFGVWKLQSKAFIDEFVGTVVTVSLANPEQVAINYSKSIDAHLLDKSAPTIGLFLTDEVPERGKDVLNNLIKAYNLETSSEEKRTTQSTIKFIDKRLASLTGELNSAEREVEGFRSSQGLTDINSQSKVYLENVQLNDNKLNEVNVQLNVINGIERYLNSTSNTENPPATIGISDPALNSSIENLAQLQLKRVALMATTPETNPVFEPIERQIRITKSSIRQSIQGIKSSLSNSKSELESFNNRFESSIRNIPGQERQFVGMKRQQSIKENLYVYLLQKREELSLSYASTLADARVVDNANVGDIKWPRIPLILSIALLLGLGLPFLVIYFRNSFNNKITSKRDIENAMNITILGELSYDDLSKDIVVLDNKHQMVGEQFRALRTNMHYLHNNKKGRGRVTLLTSSVSGEGKSFVSSNIAASLALSGRKTVILEMDLRKPKISGIFNSPTENMGVSDFLSSDIAMEDIVVPYQDIPNLSIINSGHIPPNPSELLERERLVEMITWLRENFDDILIDSPPLHLVTDAMIIARFVDVSLYVIRQGYTGMDELSYIKDVYQSNKLPNMNIVFNGIQKARYGYGYNYDNSYYLAESNKPAFNKSLNLFVSRF